jgi:hypothetical protein
MSCVKDKEHGGVVFLVRLRETPSLLMRAY